MEIGCIFKKYILLWGTNVKTNQKADKWNILEVGSKLNTIFISVFFDITQSAFKTKTEFFCK